MLPSKLESIVIVERSAWTQPSWIRGQKSAGAGGREIGTFFLEKWKNTENCNKIWKI
jgi:hypothetical protein